MANIQVKVDDNLRDQAHHVFSEMGLDVSTAVRMFLKQSVREQGFPFQPKASDPFYGEENQKHLKEVVDDLNKSRNVAHHALIEE